VGGRSKGLRAVEVIERRREKGEAEVHHPAPGAGEVAQEQLQGRSKAYGTVAHGVG